MTQIFLPVLVLVTAADADHRMPPFQRVRIIDRTVRGFDLTTVEGIVNYTSFVAKLHREHAPRLANLFEERQIRAQAFEDYKKDDARLQWNMTQKFDTKEKGKQKA